MFTNVFFRRPQTTEHAIPTASRDHPGRRRVLGSVLAVSAAAAVIAVASPAHASGVTYHRIWSVSSGLTVDVNGASPTAGTKVIQWYNNGGPGQRWALSESGTGTSKTVNGTTFTFTTDLIVNQNSGLCLNSDGTAGHWLTQEACDNRLSELWTISSSPDSDTHTLQNYGNGLWADVYGDSHDAGAVIDGWYAGRSGAQNQSFYIS